MDLEYSMMISNGKSAILRVPRIVLNTIEIDSDMEYIVEGLVNNLYRNFAKNFTVKFEQDSSTQVYFDM